MSRNILMLGTGHATATNCYNTCFLINNEDSPLLIDSGGGNGILSQFERSHTSFKCLHDMFITHAHTDHILGAVWVIRKIVSMVYSGEYRGPFHIYASSKSIDLLDYVCCATLFSDYIEIYKSNIQYIPIEEGRCYDICKIQMTFFNLHSHKLEQYGFKGVFKDGFQLTCLGDEPLHEECRPFVKGSDLLMCEAFCLYRDASLFHPYRKHHSTACDAAMEAEKSEVKSLLLYHTEDKNLKHRKELYTQEAASHFHGEVFVPDDLERIYF